MEGGKEGVRTEEIVENKREKKKERKDGRKK